MRTLIVVIISSIAFLLDAHAAGPITHHTVKIEAASYSPLTVNVKRGDTIVWVNKDPYPHGVTATGIFDSKAVDANRTWTYEAKKVGELPYVCTLHPNMKGILRVE